MRSHSIAQNQFCLWFPNSYKVKYKSFSLVHKAFCVLPLPISEPSSLELTLLLSRHPATLCTWPMYTKYEMRSYASAKGPSSVKSTMPSLPTLRTPYCLSIYSSIFSINSFRHHSKQWPPFCVSISLNFKLLPCGPLLNVFVYISVCFC